MKHPIAECDCCGEVKELTQVWYLGYQETWACDKCRGIMDEPDNEELRYNTETQTNGD